MKHLWENNWFFVPVAMFFGFCGMVAFLVPYSYEILFFNDLRHEPLNSIFQFITLFGEDWAYFVCGLAALFWRPRYAFLIGFTGLLAIPLNYALKDAVGIDRPITYFEKLEAAQQLVLVPELLLNRGQTSFPSGHTMAAFALYSLLALMIGRKHERWGLAFAMLAILVGISRIFLVQHFLIDVLAGAVLGLLLSTLVWLAAARFLPEGARGSAR